MSEMLPAVGDVSSMGTHTSRINSGEFTSSEAGGFLSILQSALEEEQSADVAPDETGESAPKDDSPDPSAEGGTDVTDPEATMLSAALASTLASQMSQSVVPPEATSLTEDTEVNLVQDAKGIAIPASATSGSAIQSGSYSNTAVLALNGTTEQPQVGGQSLVAEILANSEKEPIVAVTATSGDSAPETGKQSSLIAGALREGEHAGSLRAMPAMSGDMKAIEKLFSSTSSQSESAQAREVSAAKGDAQSSRQEAGGGLKMAQESPLQTDGARIKVLQGLAGVQSSALHGSDKSAGSAMQTDNALSAGGDEIVLSSRANSAPALAEVASAETARKIEAVADRTVRFAGDSQAVRTTSVGIAATDGYMASASRADTAPGVRSDGSLPAFTANSPTSSETTPVAAQQVLDQVATGAKLLLKRHSSELHLRLRPPVLGTVRLSLVTDEDGLSIRIDPQSSLARSLIEQNLPELRSALESHGLHVGKFSLGSGQPEWGFERGGGGNGSARFDDYRHPPSRPYLETPEGAAAPAVQSASEQRVAAFYGNHNLNILI